jgi:hypothetical protein
MGGLQKEKWYFVCYLPGKKEENECVREKNNSYM